MISLTELFAELDTRATQIASETDDPAERYFALLPTDFSFEEFREISMDRAFKQLQTAAQLGVENPMVIVATAYQEALTVGFYAAMKAREELICEFHQDSMEACDDCGEGN